MIPTLNDTPKYDLVIPSTGKEIRFRPYKVKEEKVLLTAFQSEDKKHGYKAIAETVQACIGDQADISKLTMYDLEYMFTKIRSKSSGEEANLNIKCSECNTANEVSVNIDSVVSEQKDANKKIKLDDSISVELKIPSFLQLIDDEDLMNTVQRHEKVIKTIAHSIKLIYTNDEVIDVSEEKFEDVVNFVESLNEQQFKEIHKFVEDRPKLIYNIDFKCISCSHDNHYEVKEAKHFF